MIVEIRVMLIADSYLTDSGMQNDYILLTVGVIAGSITASIILYTHYRIKKRFFKGVSK